MQALALIGFLGGLITGVSPCILPVLPVVFFSGAAGSPGGQSRARPFLLIAGLVCSFSCVTLAGSAVLSLLRLPQDAIRWAALVALILIGLGLIFPRLQHLLERPFARIPQRQVSSARGGFLLGLALGALYVPCAGPVLAAIVVAGATASIGWPTIVLTATFAMGAALPLLAFALAGRRVAERVAAFRRRQREIRVVSGITMIVLAVTLVFNVPSVLQRAIPDYTDAIQSKFAGSGEVQQKLSLGGIVNDQNKELSNCSNGAAQLQNCGLAPGFTGITQWLNTPGGTPMDIRSLRGKVVLVDFWAYSCINCQRAIPHVVDWYRKYRDDGLVVIGVHTPEYAFERIPGNVASGAAALHIAYPVALDNGYSTWTNYRNRYWPAEYLIDATGTVRHIKAGEGGYDTTENLIRRLLADANPGVRLPPATRSADTTPKGSRTPETYLGVGKVVNYAGSGRYDEGTEKFNYPALLPPDSFALRGHWALDYQGATAQSNDCAIRLNYRAKDVYIVVGGTGTVTVTRNGTTTAVPISGPPTLHQIVADDTSGQGQLDAHVSRGLQVFSFTYG